MKKTNRTFKRFAAITSASLLAACAVAPLATGITSSAVATEGKITFSGATQTEEYKAYRIFTGIAVDNGFGSEAIMSDIQWDMTDDNAATFLDNLKKDTRSDFMYVPEGESEKVSYFKDCLTAEDVAEVLVSFGYDNAKTRAFAEFAVENKALLRTSKTSSNGTITLDDGVDGNNETADTNDDGYYVIEQTSHNGTTTVYLLGVYDATKGAEVNVKVAAPTFEKKIKDANDSKPVANEKWQDSADYDIGDNVPFQLIAKLPTDYSSYKQYKLIFHDDLKDADGKAVYDNVTISKVYYDANNNNVCDAEEAITDYTSTVNGTAPTDDCDFEVTIANLKTAKSGVADGGLIKVEYTARLTENAVIGSAGNWNGAYLEYSNNPYYTGGTEDDTNETAEDKVVAFTYQAVINKKDQDGSDLTGAEFKLEKKVNGSWVEVKKVLVNNDPKFTFKGLDDGDYKLSETKTPGPEYNSIAPIEFTITATHSETAAEPKLLTFMDVDAETASASITFGTSNATATYTEGKIEADIINKTGTQLPGTGGIGTTIFYLGGGAMAAIGGVYLISKRRMKKSEE